MSYRTEMNQLAHAISELLLNGAVVPGDDIRAAVAGHSSLVCLLRVIDRDLGLENMEVAHLSFRFARQPIVTDQPLTDVLNAPAASRAGRLWRDVARTATLAQQEWQLSKPSSRPTDTTAWSEIADVAALAEGLAVLNTDIADSLSAVARWKDAASYRAGQSSLVVAARSVRRIAAGQALPAAAELQTAVTTKVLTNLPARGLPEALHRLSSMITTSPHIPPAQIDLITRTTAECALAASAVTGTTPFDLADDLREHAARLSTATGLSRRIAPLHPGDGIALTQAQEIQRLVTRLRERGQLLGRAESRLTAMAIPHVTQALATSAERQMATGIWVQRQDSSNRLPWGLSRGRHDVPTMVRELRHAAYHARLLARRATAARAPNKRPPTPPREVLAQPLAARTPWPHEKLPIPLPHIQPRQR
jgi:hypothetical protein